MRESHWPSLGWVSLPAQVKRGLGGRATLDHLAFWGLLGQVGVGGGCQPRAGHLLKGSTCIQGMWEPLPPLWVERGAIWLIPHRMTRVVWCGVSSLESRVHAPLWFCDCTRHEEMGVAQLDLVVELED